MYSTLMSSSSWPDDWAVCRRCLHHFMGGEQESMAAVG